MQVLSPSSIQAPISLLEKTPALLEALLHDVPGEVLQWKPASDRWSISEALAHLVVIEKLYEARARRIFMEEAPALAKYVAPLESEVHGKTAAQYLEQFLALRRAAVVFLSGIPVSAGTRTGTHAELGEITLAQLLHELASHDLGHLRQIAELYRACAFYPHGGPFQRYSHPRP